MQFKKLAAITGSALMGLLSVAGPVLASTVTQVGQIDNLATSAAAFPLFVVGASAQTADVAGAVNIATGMASRLGGGGAVSAVDGVEKNDIDISFGNLTDSFPNPIKSFHYSGLKTSTVAWKGNNYNYHEQVWLNGTFFSHDFGTAGINGTETMVVPSNQLAYDYVFDQAINLSSATSAGTTGTLTNPEYTYPIKVSLLGKDFLIVGIGSNQVKMLSGSVGTADASTPVVYGGYSAYATQGADNSWAKVVLKDSSGATVDTLIIDKGSSKDSSVAGLTIKVTAVRALTDGTIVGADLVVGPTNAVEKTYSTSCDITSTGSSDTKYPGETEWCIQVSGFGTSGVASANDKLQVVYKPQSTKYFKMTDASPVVKLPNNYGDIGFEGWNYNTFATLTFKPITGTSAYNTTGALIASNLNGIAIESDTVGTLVDQATNTGYQKAYILFNYTYNSTHAPVILGFWSAANSRIEIPGTITGGGTSGTYYKLITTTGGPGSNDSAAFNITVSYGGGAGATDQQFIYANVSLLEAGNQVNGGTGSVSLFRNFTLQKAGGNFNAVRLNYVNKTSTWSSSAAPEFRLYTSDSADAKDVQVRSTDTGGNVQVADVGTSTQDVVADSGVIVVSPNSNSGSQQIVVKVPAQALKVKAYVGKLGGAVTTTGGVKITSDVVKLDSEVTAADKAGSDLVLVGGPCVNTLVAELNTAGKFPYSCTGWPGRDFGRIQLISDAFASGYTALVVAGTRAQDTDLAARVVQTGTGLSGRTESAVEVTGSVASPVVTAA